MLSRIAGRFARLQRTVSRATALPVFVRLGIGLSTGAALAVAWPTSLVTSRYLFVVFLVAAYPALAPRGRAVTFSILCVLAGWLFDTVWYDARIALWRVLAIASLTYLAHTLAALAAVLPTDATVSADVVVSWLGRALIVLLGSAVLTVIVLGVTARLAGGAFLLATLAGLAAAVAATLLLARLLRRS